MAMLTRFGFPRYYCYSFLVAVRGREDLIEFMVMIGDFKPVGDRWFCVPFGPLTLSLKVEG